MPRVRRWAGAAPGRCRAPPAPRCAPRDGAAPEGGCGGPRPPARPPRLRQRGPGGGPGARGPPQPAGGMERGRPGAAAPAAGSAAPPRLASPCPGGCSPAAAAARRGELAERGERLGRAAGCVGWGFVGTKTCGSGDCAETRCGPVGFCCLLLRGRARGLATHVCRSLPAAPQPRGGLEGSPRGQGAARRGGGGRRKDGSAGNTGKTPSLFSRGGASPLPPAISEPLLLFFLARWERCGGSAPVLVVSRPRRRQQPEPGPAALPAPRPGPGFPAPPLCPGLPARRSGPRGAPVVSESFPFPVAL